MNQLGWTFLTEELCLLLTDSCKNATSIVNPEKALLLLLFRNQLASGLFSERSLESAFD